MFFSKIMFLLSFVVVIFVVIVINILLKNSEYFQNKSKMQFINFFNDQNLKLYLNFLSNKIY